MEVEWSTMEAIARTQAIDVWILFPSPPCGAQASRAVQFK
jgi:hypothetical protein